MMSINDGVEPVENNGRQTCKMLSSCETQCSCFFMTVCDLRRSNCRLQGKTDVQDAQKPQMEMCRPVSQLCERKLQQCVSYGWRMRRTEGGPCWGSVSTSQYQPAKWLCLNECFSPGSQASCWALLRFGAMAPRSKCKTNRLSV